MCKTCGGTTFSWDVLISPTMLIFFSVLVLILIILALFSRDEKFRKMIRKRTESALQLSKKVFETQKQLESASNDFQINSDGSITFRKKKEIDSPEVSETTTTSMDTAIASITVRTTIVTKATAVVMIKTTIRPSSALLAGASKARKAQVKIKSLTSFGQISINVGFNCHMTFPSSVERTLNSIKVLNLDIVPSLGFNCRFAKFDYINRMLAVTVIPIATGLCMLIGLKVYEYSSNFKKGGNDVDVDELYIVPQDMRGVFTDKLIHAFRETFKHYDEDGSGQIDKKEMANVIREFDPASSEAEVEERVQEFFNEADADGSGLVDFGEFLKVVHQARHMKRESKFAALVDKVEAKLTLGLKQTVLYFFFLLTYLVLVSTSATLFNYLQCQIFPMPEGQAKRFMFKDYSIDCNSDRYQSWEIYCGVMILIYPIGIPSLYATMLWMDRETLRDQDAMDRELLNGFPSVGHIKFLVEAYKPKYFFFEVVECFRRLLLASVIGVLSADSPASSVIGLIGCFVFIYVFVEMKPFKADDDCNLGIVLAYALTFFFLAALMIKVDVANESSVDSNLFGALLLIVLGVGPFAVIIQLASSQIKTRHSLGNMLLGGHAKESSPVEYQGSSIADEEVVENLASKSTVSEATL